MKFVEQLDNFVDPNNNPPSKATDERSLKRLIKSEFTKFLKGLGATNIEVRPNYFIVTGFFDLNGQVWNFSTGDFRLTSLGMCVRKAKSHKDFGGNSYNQFVHYNDSFEAEFERIVSRG